MGSIPLPALGVKVPEQPNALEVMRSMQQLQAGQQEAQMNALKIQQAKRDQQEQQTITQTIGQTGGDLEKAIPMLTGKVSQAKIDALKKSDLDHKKELSEYDDKTFALTQKKHGALADLYQQAQNLPDDQYAQAWPQIAASANTLEPKLQLNPAQPIPKQSLSQLGIGLSVSENYIKAEAEKRAAKKEPLEEKKLQAETDKAVAEAENIKKYGGTGIDVREMADFISNPPKGYKGTPTDFARWKATLAPVAQINVANAAGGGMSDAATDQAAERYHLTGQLPPGNRGVAGLAQNRKIMNRAADLFPGSMTADSAEYKANQSSLSKLQTNYDQVTAFESTAGKNLDVFLGTAKKIVDSGSPLVNMPLRVAAGQVTGSENQAAFNAARTTALTEIAKVLNSSNASGVLSDSARHEVEGLIGPNATLKQVYAAANILKQDMGNRKQAYQEQIKDIQGRMGGKKPAPATSSPSSGGFDWNAHPKVNQ